MIESESIRESDNENSQGSWFERAFGRSLNLFYEGLGTTLREAKWAQPENFQATREENRVYRPPMRQEIASGFAATHRFHTYDFYAPSSENQKARDDITAIYVHGGGFRICSKDTHFLMGLQLSAFGYKTYLPNYRLSTHAPYPAALEDLVRFLEFLDAKAQKGEMSSSWFLIGESAGAHLALVLTLMRCVNIDHPLAKRVSQLSADIVGLAPLCGIYDLDRRENMKLPETSSLVMSRVGVVCREYFMKSPDYGHDSDILGRPLEILHHIKTGVLKVTRDLPKLFSMCGTADPVLEDSRKLRQAFEALSHPIEYREYRDEVHAFHAFFWRQEAKRCWNHLEEFLTQLKAKNLQN